MSAAVGLDWMCEPAMVQVSISSPLWPGLSGHQKTQSVENTKDPWNGLLWTPKERSPTSSTASECSTEDSYGSSNTHYSSSGSPKLQPVLSKTAPASTRLRHLIENSKDVIVAPGVYDGLSARIALSVGFDAMYMTSAGTTASRLGKADLNAQLHDMHENAEMIAGLEPHGAPLIADMDTGYGGPLVIAKSVQRYVEAGVAGFQIEDQVRHKRCELLSGKEVVDSGMWLQSLRAAIAARDSLESDAVIIARTDALQSKGYADCIARLEAARDAGADVGILEGFETREQARRAVQDLAPWPLLLNSVENGRSPLFTVADAQEMGFRLMIFSFASLAPAYTAIRNTFEWLKAEGVTGSDVRPNTIFRVCGLEDSITAGRNAEVAGEKGSDSEI